MWPLIMAVLRRNAVYITLPIAGVVGFIGYNLESLLSDKYTPYSSKWTILFFLTSESYCVFCLLESVQENRAERLTEDEVLANATHVEKLRLKENVLERNLPPSLQQKKI